MKFSEKWLRGWVEPGVTRDELVARLSMVGLEVDAVTPVAAEFSGVVVGEVLAVEQHPDADKLRVCQVSDGKERHQVVCGASNVRAGLKVPFAMLGAKLPGDFSIKKAKLRGVESFGMLCAASELGLAEQSDGLLELPADAPVGVDFRVYAELDDVSIEIGLTPNRGDCLSIAGLAREVGAVYGVPFAGPAIEPQPAACADVLPVVVAAPKACPRYVGRVLRGVDLSRPSPRWMVERLRRSDIRSIDAVVDVTNYVMLELGQPMHAFDLAQLNGEVQVRMAAPDEGIVLLDGQALKLRSDTLVIADRDRALAIAGVMGGEHSGVSATTCDLFLESAFFDPIALAGKARSYGLHTDSSHRFERGVDFELPRKAIERATELLLEIVGGTPGPVIDVTDAEALPQVAPIGLRGVRVQQMLGIELTDEYIVRTLTGLGLGVQQTAAGEFQVSVPSHRFDLTLEVDLIEELGRLYGYDRLPVRYPQARLAPSARPEARAELSSLRRLLAARGYQEAITYSFIDPKLFELFSPGVEPLALANPISADLAVMRSSLWPGLIKALQHNLNRQQSRVRLFETGLRFVGQLGNLRQENMIAGVVVGNRLPEGWANGRESVDFYDVKADVEALLAQAGAADQFSFAAASHVALHPGQSAVIKRGERVVGHMGALNPTLAQVLGIDQAVYLFELELAPMTEGRLPAFRELSRFPEVRRDLAFVLDRGIAAGDVLSAIRLAAGEYLTELKLFDVYHGKGVDSTGKSLAVSLTWQHPSRTLNDEEVNAYMQQILTSLEEGYGASLRK